MANAIVDGLLSATPGLMDVAPLPPGVKAGMNILGQLKGCGATSKANPPSYSANTTPVPVNSNGRHAIVYWVEQNTKTNLPLLPTITGATNSTASREALKKAFRKWSLKLKMDVTRTEEMNSANLIITGKVFAAPTPTDVVALTDIGPLFDHKCRLIFDLGEKLTEDEFMYTAAHEFGHALGIRHADVPSSGHLMSPVMDISIKQPTKDGDLKAAVSKGWKLS